MDWLRARLSEGNTLRAIAVVVATLGATRLLDPATIGAAAQNIEQMGMLLLAFDAFVTRTPKQ